MLMNALVSQQIVKYVVLLSVRPSSFYYRLTFQSPINQEALRGSTLQHSFAHPAPVLKTLETFQKLRWP